jgi:hypothetical protein
MTKAAAKQRAKAAIKLAKPKGNSKSHAARPKKTGNGQKWGASDGSNNNSDEEPHERSHKKAKKATEIEEVVEKEAGVKEITNDDDDKEGKKANSDTEEDEVTFQ